MGCQCGKHPDELSVNLQKKTEQALENNAQMEEYNLIGIPKSTRDDYVLYNNNNNSNPYPHNESKGEMYHLGQINNNSSFTLGQPLKNSSKDNNNTTDNLGNKGFNDDPLSMNDPSSFNKKSLMYSFEEQMLFQLNQIRTNPKSFINEMNKAINNISIRHDKYLYTDVVKVQLVRGKEVFEEAIEYLNTLQPMEPLTFCEAITIQAPITIEEIEQKGHLSQEIQKYPSKNIDFYFRDMISDPTSALILAIAGANERNDSKKGKAFLNPDFKNIGITSTIIFKRFCAYYTFN